MTIKETHVLDFRSGPLAGVRLEWNGKAKRLRVMPVPGDGKTAQMGRELLSPHGVYTQDLRCLAQLSPVVSASSANMGVQDHNGSSLWLHSRHIRTDASTAFISYADKTYTVCLRKRYRDGEWHLGCLILTTRQVRTIQRRVCRFLVEIGALGEGQVEGGAA